MYFYKSPTEGKHGSPLKVCIIEVENLILENENK